jgi:hypothetical protein
MKRVAVLFVMSMLSVKAFSEQTPLFQGAIKPPIGEADELYFEEESDLEEEEDLEGYEEG